MHTNRLIDEKSPYLLQHAHNPVDWRAWGEQAFAEARELDRPIFLSIGYSTCHWCHVMERESFENADVAAVLNRHFIPVKVDREERPDVDRIYMTFVQATTGGGGWPMSVWLTPGLKPFFGGTYFPPESRYGRPGFRAILEYIANAWANERAKILEASADVVEQLRKLAAVAPEGLRPDDTIPESCFLAFRRGFDARLGGFGGAPKFPRATAFNFLLRYHHETGNEEALEMTLKTLREMAKGGMHDHLGGGFHRYSVDARWFVPHFEKMLYDQAQIAVSYLEAFQITSDETLAAVARGIFTYVLRDMTSPEGAFYSAEDADSVIDPAQPEQKGEGAFYIWAYDEIARLLDPQTAEWFFHRYGVLPGGNVDEDPHGEFAGRNILFEDHTVEETAGRFNAPVDEARATLDRARELLLAERSKRVRPHLDDKILTSWNGLMISAFAKGCQALGEEGYGEAARRAADFLLARMWDPEARTLLRRYRDGEAAIPGFLDDYAFFAQALLDLYEAVFDTRYLDAAHALTVRMRELFEDPAQGGFFSTAEGDASLVLRMKDDYDGAEPSGNSVAVLNLVRLARLTQDAAFREAAAKTIDAFASRLKSAPTGVPQMAVAYLASRAKPSQVVIAGGAGDPGARALLAAVRWRFRPYLAVLFADRDSARERLARWLPYIGGAQTVDGRAAAYVCENYSCRLPVTDPSELAGLLH